MVGRRYQQGGMERALYEKQRPGAAEVLDESQKQRLIAMVCSSPPQGRARWTIRLVAEEAVKCKLVPRVGRETVRILLLSHDLKPWREKKWVVADLDDDYIGKMEDVLAVYERPYDPQQPVICLDEKPIALHADLRSATPAAPGREARRDNEYERRRTANVFCSVEPKAGRHFTFATPDRSGFEFAQVAVTLAMAYPEAKNIHLVMDNLNIHRRKALEDVFGAEMAEVWDRFTVHYTPKHGSWLSQAEIEIGVFSRQCLGRRRIPDLQTLRQEAKAWNRRINRDGVKISGSSTARWRAESSATKRKLSRGHRTSEPAELPALTGSGGTAGSISGAEWPAALMRGSRLSEEKQ
ncbi:MAG: IS630 family transposase, partial [Bryobacteraceae bacterium]